MKYKVGDKVRIKSLGWYDENKDVYGYIECGKSSMNFETSQLCGKIVTISRINDATNTYRIEEDNGLFFWTDEMIEGLVEEGTKSEQKFHIGDWATDGDVLAEDSCIFIIQKLGDNSTAAKTYCTLHNDGYFEKGSILYFDIDSTKPATEDEKQKLFRAIKDNGYKWNSETKTLEKLIEPLDVPTMTTEFVKEHGLPCPEGYIFKDQNGNEIHALKIVLEKANTLKIQNDNMETETHKGYCTTDVETTNESKKVAWFTFGDNDFADKVELDLSDRELIHEDGKWFVVKKKKEYPKTYTECSDILAVYTDPDIDGYKGELLWTFQKLLICRDAYWKIAGDWKPDYQNKEQKTFFFLFNNGNYIEKGRSEYPTNKILIFPTEEMRDYFYENFKELIESVKELL